MRVSRNLTRISLATHAIHSLNHLHTPSIEGLSFHQGPRTKERRTYELRVRLYDYGRIMYGSRLVFARG